MPYYSFTLREAGQEVGLDEEIEADSEAAARRQLEQRFAFQLRDRPEIVEVTLQPRCRGCGGRRLRTVEALSASCDLVDVGVFGDRVDFEFSGEEVIAWDSSTTVAFECEDCLLQAETLEALIGLEPDPPPVVDELRERCGYDPDRVPGEIAALSSYFAYRDALEDLVAGVCEQPEGRHLARARLRAETTVEGH